MSKKRIIDTKDTFFKPISALNDEQKEYIRTINENRIIICTGRPGSGKTAVACGIAAENLYYERTDKIIISRPCIGAEDVGYLPGTGKEKVRPYLQPMLNELSQFIDIKKCFEDKNIEITPVSEMRGITFKDSFVIIDESQNLSARLLRMILTRLGKNSKIILTGDIRQSDLNKKSIQDFQNVIQQIIVPLICDGWPIGLIDLKNSVRDPLVEAIDQQFDTVYN